MPEVELKIPPTCYKEGNAHEHYTTGFIKYTNCLEIDKTPKTSEILLEIMPKTAHYVAIPQGTSVPRCEEAKECIIHTT